MALDIFGQKIASREKRRQYSRPLWDSWILCNMLAHRYVGTIAQGGLQEETICQAKFVPEVPEMLERGW